MEENIDSLVRRVVNHPSFREAVNNTDANSPGTSASSTASSSCGTPQSSSNTQQRTQTPRQELQSLFRRGSSQNDALPEFQQRTCWGPARSGSRFLRHETREGRKADPYSKNRHSMSACVYCLLLEQHKSERNRMYKFLHTSYVSRQILRCVSDKMKITTKFG